MKPSNKLLALLPLIAGTLLLWSFSKESSDVETDETSTSKATTDNRYTDVEQVGRSTDPVLADNHSALGRERPKSNRDIEGESGTHGTLWCKIEGEGHQIDDFVVVPEKSRTGELSYTEYERNFERITLLMDEEGIRRESRILRPVKLYEEASLYAELQTKERKGQSRVSVTLHPNVQESPEGGTIVDIDGVVLGFRLVDLAQRGYEVVVLSMDNVRPDGELEWFPVMGIGSEPDPYVEETIQLLRDLEGTGSAQWPEVSLDLDLDYDGDTWRFGGVIGQILDEAFPLHSKPEPAPAVRIDSGFGGETLVMDVYASDAEQPTL